MKTDTAPQIVEFIKKKGSARVADLVDELGISAQAIHRHLKKLVESERLVKRGSPPKVLYQVVERALQPGPSFPSLPPDELAVLERHFAYVTPAGELQKGLLGFQTWIVVRNMVPQYQSLARHYGEVLEQANNFFHKNDYLDATFKIRDTFATTFLDGVYYGDFYSLPQFGRTEAGSLVYLGKSGQSLNAIKTLVERFLPAIESIIREKGVQAVLWTPHSLPRKVSFLPEFRKRAHVTLPEIKAIKAFSGNIPIAQKALSKLEERIHNARNTTFIDARAVPYERVLIIDDAVGSGATLNEIAAKLKNDYGVKAVYGFALVGSYKGFEVLSQV